MLLKVGLLKQFLHAKARKHYNMFYHLMFTCVKSAMGAASQLPGGEPTDVNDVPASAR